MQDPDKKRLFYVIASILVLGVLLDGAAMNVLLNILIAGVVPGTHLSVPYWAMLTLYCLVITAIATWAVECYFGYKRQKQSVSTTSKSHISGRKYSHN